MDDEIEDKLGFFVGLFYALPYILIAWVGFILLGLALSRLYHLFFGG